MEMPNIDSDWTAFSQLLNLPDVKSLAWKSKLFDLYEDPLRHYHKLSHLRSIFNLRSSLPADAIERPAEVEIAIWFHDAIYDVHRSDNEDASAALAKEFCIDVGVAHLANRVGALIMATKSHEVEAAADKDLKLFLDLDMSILGASPEEYDAYSAQIYGEYSIVYSEKDFRAGRAKVLQAFQKWPTIYHTEVMRGRFERMARENIARELSLLLA
ncbi:hypothetical protein HK101_010386 [Irineochytrium annulatum]|nr:hypothetical protein HK101_010386 [Irineochytrium annulatum]